MKKKIAGQGAPSADIMTPYRSSYQDFGGRNLQATPNLRALIIFRSTQISVPKLRYLRVLHIEDSTLEDLSHIIEGCIHLRCLILIRCIGVGLPSSIGKLLTSKLLI